MNNKAGLLTCWTWVLNVLNCASVQHTFPVIVGHKLWIFADNNSSGCHTKKSEFKHIIQLSEKEENTKKSSTKQIQLTNGIPSNRYKLNKHVLERMKPALVSYLDRWGANRAIQHFTIATSSTNVVHSTIFLGMSLSENRNICFTIQ